MKASDLFVRCLEEEGVEYVFGVPGEENLDLLESLRTSPIRLVVCRHEQHAAFMAATYGRLTGRAGVCLATLGPGATNLLTGIAFAQLGGMPMVAITGQKAVLENWQGTFQLVDVVGTFRPLTKWNTTLVSARAIPRALRHAFKLAENERPGVTHLELPEDVASRAVDGGRPQRRVRLRRPVPDDKAVALAAEMIRRAERPILILSAGANRKRIGKQLVRFVDATGIYAVTTQMGKGVFPDDHPRSLFSLGIHKRDYVHVAVESADLVITAGYNIVEYPPSVWNPDKDKRILHLDFSIAEPDEYYNPDLEVVGDVSYSLWAIRERLTGSGGGGGGDRPDDEEGGAGGGAGDEGSGGSGGAGGGGGAPLFDDPRLARLRGFLEERLHREHPEPCHPPKPQTVVHDVRRVMAAEDVICLDNGIYKLWFARMYPTYADNTVLLDNALATMGAGLASAMTAKLVCPERRVMAIVGDGGFMMNSQDLETAVRLELALVVLLLRDDAYGFIRWKQQGMGFPDYGMALGNPDFVAYAEAYGAGGLRLGPEERLPEVLEAAFARAEETRRPVLVDCPIDYSENAELSRDLAAEARRFLGG